MIWLVAWVAVSAMIGGLLVLRAWLLGRFNEGN